LGLKILRKLRSAASIQNLLVLIKKGVVKLIFRRATSAANIMQYATGDHNFV